MRLIKSFFINILVIFLVLFILISLSGCTSENTKGTSQSVGDAHGDKITFDTAYSTLSASFPADGGKQLKIFYLHGSDLDLNASAREWTFGVQYDTNPLFYFYNNRGGTTLSMSEPFHYSEIRFDDQVMRPDLLLAAHRSFLEDITQSENPQIDELELVDGQYRMYIHVNNETNEYNFDAKTGNDIPFP